MAEWLIARVTFICAIKVSGIGRYFAVCHGKDAVLVTVVIIRQVLVGHRTLVVGVWLTTGLQHGKKVFAVGTKAVRRRATVQPDVFLGAVNVAVDGCILTYILTSAVNMCVEGGKGCAAHGIGNWSNC